MSSDIGDVSPIWVTKSRILLYRTLLLYFVCCYCGGIVVPLCVKHLSYVHIIQNIV